MTPVRFFIVIQKSWAFSQRLNFVFSRTTSPTIKYAIPLQRLSSLLIFDFIVSVIATFEMPDLQGFLCCLKTEVCY